MDASKSPPAGHDLVQKLLDLADLLRSEEQGLREHLSRFQDLYRDLDPAGRFRFFSQLLCRVEVSKQKLAPHLATLQAADEQQDPLAWSRLLTELRHDLESPRLQIFRRFMDTPGGLKFLLDLRADVLAAQRLCGEDFSPLDMEIAHLFNSWFHHGFLLLREVTQDSPFREIRYLVRHDMVHPMTGLEEMVGRLGRDRRCFALYHRAMSEEPVVFIEVALTRGVARTIHDVLADSDEGMDGRPRPDTAIFYSINNTQDGLTGLGLARVLIFQVVEAIREDWPEIRTFATLSPIPGLLRFYLEPILRGEDAAFLLKLDALEALFAQGVRKALLDRYREMTRRRPRNLAAAVLGILQDPAWIDDPVCSSLLRRPLAEITTHYLTREKNSRGKPLCPVANFHLSNGATFGKDDVNFAANRTRRGLESSCGMMVNYVYLRQ